jgi:hypothetical protein
LSRTATWFNFTIQKNKTMKQLFFVISVIACLGVQATVRTVSNFPATIAQFSNIQAAVDAANDGDTIYVHGSPNQYSSFDLTSKRVTVIGPGWSPDKQLPFDAVINTDIIVAGVNGIDLTGAASSGTEIQGVTIVGGTGVRIQTSGINNIRFIRIHTTSPIIFSGSVSPGSWTGYLFEGCMFNNGQVRSDNPNVHNMANFLFQNNIFFENGCCIGGNISNFTNVSSILFDHNLWFGNGSSPRDCFAGNSRFLTITNNIFVRRNAATQNSFSTFNNNITFNSGNDTPWLSNSNTDAGGNVSNQDPQMVDQAAVNNGSLNGTGDYTIAAGPANGTGSDLKDMGLLFDGSGSLNWTNSRNSRLPRIFSMNITTPTVPAGGNVTVNVNARVSN